MIITPNIALEAEPRRNKPDEPQEKSYIRATDSVINHTRVAVRGLDGSEKADIFELDFNYDNNNIYVQASAESRIAASFIDFGILNILSLACIFCILLISGYKINKSLLQIKEHIILIYFVLLFLSTSYFVLMQGFGGRTMGKVILSLKVIKKEGLEIGFVDSFIRFIRLLHLDSSCVFGVYMVLYRLKFSGLA
ncbi:MAG: RDD family protein [Candidatus Dadabacteria bacterium]|nr:RDD family protein [Candidatus Dadabacteria bacterium]NIS07926.1 RDD family protein [Candidatus Dadabacteria bacterium]NIY21510.1 hypothetical protein [Candidatus Dadabacteria bacterium]